MTTQYHYVVIAEVSDEGQTQFILEGDLSSYQEDGLFIYDVEEDEFREESTEDAVDDMFNREQIKEAVRFINNALAVERSLS